MDIFSIFSFQFLIFIYINQLNKQHIIHYGQQFGLLFIKDLQYTLIYNRIITMIVLTVFQLLIIYMGFKFQTTIKRQKFNSSIIATTLLHLYVSNYAALIQKYNQIIIILYFFIIGQEDNIRYRIYIRRCIIALQFTKSQKMDNWLCFTRIRIDWMSHPICTLSTFIELTGYYFEKFKQMFYQTSIETNWIRQGLEGIYVIYSMNTIITITFGNGSNYGKKQLHCLDYVYYSINDMQENRNLIYLIIQTNQMYQLDKYVQLQYFQLQLNIQVNIVILRIIYFLKQENKSTSVLIEIILVLLYLKLSCPFVIDLLRVYRKKYKILLLSNIYDALKVINCNLYSFITNNKILIRIIKVLILLLLRSLVNLLNSQSTSRLAMLGLDQKAQKIIRLEKN
ncbi:unnamed protein product [Paramecium pentaurelia]|uniref:Transmembrane protein n=1 Tax=Paramecium pentaurelia TaxID=43138 RepID=A0A8S1XLI5_9CILI|nr:unnamed protein product [Paramecium pentaurelia]